MKNKSLLIIALFTIQHLFSANYFVQLGTEGAASWSETVVSANSGILVNLNTEGKSLPAWYNATFTSNPATAEEGHMIYIITGKYMFDVPITHKHHIHIYGGYNGNSIESRQKSEPDFWSFTNATIWDGNNNTSAFINGTGASSGNNVIIDGITLQNGLGPAVKFRTVEILRNCKLINNKGTGKGGATLLYGGGNILNCYFEGNSCSGTVDNGVGGDMAIIGAGNRVIDGCMFISSTAENKGAVMHISGSSTTTFSNNLVRGAQTKAALYISSTATVFPVVNIINCSFVDNTVTSIYLDVTPKVKIYNCVFWASPDLTAGLAKVGGAADANTIMRNCAIRENPPATWTSADNFILENTNTGDTPNAKYPGFVNPGNNDFRITATSSLLDAGAVFEDSPNSKDFSGTIRPQGIKPDIGFHEFTVSTAIEQIQRTLEFRCYAINDKMMIENKEQLATLTRIFNTTGTLIHEEVLNPGETISIFLSKGIYLINMRNAEGVKNIKTLMP